MPNNFNHNQKQLLIYGGLILLILVVAIGMGAYVLGRNMTSANEVVAVTPTPTIMAQPPLLVTNTPTTMPPATATSTAIPSPTLSPTPSPTPTPTPIVVITHVAGLGKLETVEFAMQTVVDLENDPVNLWERMLGTDQISLIAEGEIIAGFDLEKVSEGDIVVNGSSVQLTLPPPEILHSRIDNERTRVYERSTGLFLQPDSTLESRARLLAEEALLKWALERDILSRAQSNGILQLENLLRSLGFTQIEITVKEIEE
jgi:hypothetical protein